jgi:hypothetical protein
MHSPSLLTPIVAAEVIGSHTRAAADSQRAGRRRGLRFGLRRRSAASRAYAPRGRTVPPFAH